MGDLKVFQGNIAEVTGVDVIVNAANPGLRPGGGVCGAIYAAAGDRLDSYMSSAHPLGCHTGSVVMSPSFDIAGPDRPSLIMHAVGPDVRQCSDNQAASVLFIDTWLSVFAMAQAYQVESIAAPLISTGIYGFDKFTAIFIVVETILDQKPDLDITLVTFDDADTQAVNGFLKMADFTNS